MKIRQIESFSVKQPSDGRTYSLIRVTTESGPIGWGEAPSVSARDLSLAQATCAGQDATRFEVLRTKLEHVDGGLRSAIIMAAVDIVGQVSKAPAYQVMGGPTRNKVRALTEWSEAAAKAGHRAFIVDAKYQPQPGFDYVVNGGASMTPVAASLLAVQLEKNRPLWLDEPCRATNVGALRKISEESVTPIGWGVHASSTAIIQDMLREQVVDVVRLGLRRFDLWTIRKTAALAETYYTAVAPGAGHGPVATAAALHLAASMPNFFIQEVPWAAGEDAKMRAELVGANIEQVKDGYFALPTGAGLGIKVSEAALRRYAA
jgi:galactonate dehydratase